MAHRIIDYPSDQRKLISPTEDSEIPIMIAGWLYALSKSNITLIPWTKPQSSVLCCPCASFPLPPCKLPHTTKRCSTHCDSSGWHHSRPILQDGCGSVQQTCKNLGHIVVSWPWAPFVPQTWPRTVVVASLWLWKDKGPDGTDTSLELHQQHRFWC
jgi:hypothetical protein